MTDLIAADFGIRQLHARFVDAVWRQDKDDFAQCWTREGEWKIAGLTIVGHAALADASVRMLGRCTRIQLLTGQPILEAVADGTVQGRMSMTEFAWMPDGTQFITFGWYHDIYAEEGGRWRFLKRFWSFKYRGPLDLSAELIPTPDYGRFPEAPGPDEETYVRKA